MTTTIIEDTGKDERLAALKQEIRQTLQQTDPKTHALAEKTMSAVDDIIDAKDYSNLPPEAQASLRKQQALNDQMVQLVENQLPGVQQRFNQTSASYMLSISLGALTFGGATAFAGRKMALWKNALATTAAATAGFLGGHFLKRAPLQQAAAEMQITVDAINTLQNDLIQERETFLTKAHGYAEQLVGKLEQQTSFADKAPKTTIADLAAPANAASSHTGTIEKAPATCGCKR